MLVTESEPRESESLMRKIKKLPNIKAKATIHILQRMGHDHRSSNSYLNLARLFARSGVVALFPASPVSPIPRDLYSTAIASIAHTEDPSNTSSLSPLVLAPLKLNSKSILPFSPLAPMLVAQEHPVWCSERFFSAPSREEDWDECLWQFWINSYGTLRALTEPNWKVSRNRTRDPEGALPVEVRTSCNQYLLGLTRDQQIIHRRLSNRARHESCVHAARRLKDRAEEDADPKRAHWLKKTCRQASSLFSLLFYSLILNASYRL